MEATIKIRCSDPDELIIHLQVIIEQIQAANIQPDFEDLLLEDNNCYGDHKCLISDYNSPR